MPHLAEELWEIPGHDKSEFLSVEWTAYDNNKMKADTVEIAVQINGKSRQPLRWLMMRIRTVLFIRLRRLWELSFQAL